MFGFCNGIFSVCVNFVMCWSVYVWVFQCVVCVYVWVRNVCLGMCVYFNVCLFGCVGFVMCVVSTCGFCNVYCG